MSWGKFKSMYWGWGMIYVMSRERGGAINFVLGGGGGGGECVNGIKHVLQGLQIKFWV